MQEKIHLLNKFGPMIIKINDSKATRQGIGVLTDIGIRYKSDEAVPYIIKFLDQIKDAKNKQNDAASVTAADDGKRKVNEAK